MTYFSLYLNEKVGILSLAQLVGTMHKYMQGSEFKPCPPQTKKEKVDM